MDLKLELDLIYQNVYRLNESLSPEDFRLLEAGFEDGINEGIGKLFGKAAGWISDLPNKARKGAKFIADKTKDLYKRGKEWAGNAIDKMKNWMSETYSKIKNWMSEAGQSIAKGFNTFVEKMKDAFSSMGKKLVELWEATKDKSKAFWEATKNLFSKIVDGIKTGYKSTKEWLVKMGGNISEWVQKNWERLKVFAGNVKDKMSEMYLKAIEMLKKGGTALKKWINIVALYLIVKPTQKIKEWLKKIPELYEKYSKMLKEFIDRELQDFKLGFEEGSGRPWDREKGFINPLEKPEWSKPNMNVDVSNPLGDVEVYKGGTDYIFFKSLKTPGSKIADVQADAIQLISDPSFIKKYSNYNIVDFKKALRNEKFTEKAIEFIVRFWSTKTKKGTKKSMPIPGDGPGVITAESFKYLKTFESFKY
jgi:hypothetical protein